MDRCKPLEEHSQRDFGRYRQAVCTLRWSPKNSMVVMIIIESDASPHLLDYAGSPRVEGLNNGLVTTPVR